jgi:hypothetical protein
MKPLAWHVAPQRVPQRGWRILLASSLLLTLLPLLTGCFNPFDPRSRGAGISTPPPVPDSPTNVLRLLQWAYNNRSIGEYREIFTADYRFAFSALDPFGDAYKGDVWTREDELASATHLFQGGNPTEPAATSITLLLDTNFNVRRDPRPNKDDRMHKSIHTTVVLTIEDPTPKTTQVTGFATFYLVRGDVALLPEELKLKGFGPDSTRWYIEKWDDDTANNNTGGGGRALAAPRAPARATSYEVLRSWGEVKVIYR